MHALKNLKWLSHLVRLDVVLNRSIDVLWICVGWMEMEEDNLLNNLEEKIFKEGMVTTVKSHNKI